MLNPREGLLLYTDGSYGKLLGTGGWAWLGVDSEENEFDSGGVLPPTTSNRMELEAAIRGLNSLYESYGPCPIELVSDSMYMVMGCKDRDRKRVANLDLWERLDRAVDQHEEVAFRHVRGHVGLGWNEVANDMAIKARKETSV